LEKIWYIILGSFIILSLVVLTFSNHPIHEEIHAASAFLAIILGALSFKAYFRYRLVRLIFSGLAFMTFGIAEGIQVYIVEENMNSPGSLQEIEEYLIVLGLGLFGIGTMVKVRNTGS
jgi:hypothetical protein